MTGKRENNYMIQHLRDSVAESIPILETQLQELVQEVDAHNLFVTVSAHILLMDVSCDGKYSSQAPPQLETLAFYLYTHFGQPSEKTVSAIQSQRCLNILDDLCSKQTAGDLLSDTDDGDGARTIGKQVQAYTNAVRGTAYPEQTTDKINIVQGKFEDWFSSRLSIGPMRAQAILWAIAKAHGNTLRTWLPDIQQAGQEGQNRWKEAHSTPKSRRSQEQHQFLLRYRDVTTAGIWSWIDFVNRAAVADLPVQREDIHGDDLPPSPDEWDALLRLIGLTPTDRAGMQEIVDVRQRPLYVLPDGRVVLADLSHALDILWERFDQEARQDQWFYEKRYREWKSDWLEKQTAKYLKRVFPEGCVYQGLTYPDPDKPPGSETELDVAVAWGPFLVLIEGKAKQFRLQSQLGNIARLSGDLAANIQDAFEQGRRAVRYINATATPEFTEKETGRKLTIHKATVRRTYLIAISLHQFAGLLTQLAGLSDLNLFSDGEYPLAISLPDLDIVTQFCEGPDVFLHYVERRLDVQKNVQEVNVPDEFDLFGAYLQTRLQASRIWARDGRQFGRVVIEGYSDLFDTWMDCKRENIAELPDIRLKVPDEVRGFLTELRQRDDNDSRWIAFAMLALPDDAIRAITEFLRQVRANPPQSGRFRRSAYQNGDIVISFVATVDVPQPVLCERVEARAHIEKYTRKITKSVGFGIDLRSRIRPFECAYLIEGSWEPDKEMERQIAEDREFLLPPGTKLPERNDPCFCGSGVKFKKCCLSRVEKARRERVSNP